jgi:hypothetical protein
MVSDDARRLPDGKQLTGWQQAPVRLMHAVPVCLFLMAAVPNPVFASGIYTCIDSQGKRLTADRPIAACATREQQVLNRDGSVRTVLPPTLTAKEQAQKEASERAANEARAAQADAVRRDRNLMARYANEAAHNRAREASLDTVRLAITASEIRLRELAQARKPLLDETEFYKGRPMPAKLKSAIDANDAALEAQRSATANQKSELDRINAMYDAELDRLRRLWAGAAPGSLGQTAPANVAVRPGIPPQQ